MGKRASLVNMGWNLIVIYVGQQPAGTSRCSKTTLTAAQGFLDAEDAERLATGEGFSFGSSVYLDLEPVDPTSHNFQPLEDYAAAWVTQMLRGNFLPGIYCHLKNAEAIRHAIEAIGIHELRYWVCGGKDFTLFEEPSASGIDWAVAWQGPTVKQSVRGAWISIDENVSTLAAPSAPLE